jgi:SAM-dependent methyltransferase
VTPKVVVDDVKAWIDRSLDQIAKEGTILELGSGFGRDANFIESNGFKVIRSEAVHGVVDFMQRNGQNAKLLNAITDDLGGPYDMVFADAVLLHFTRADTEQVLKKICNALKTKGILSFRLKQGDGSGWEGGSFGSPRFFQYWQPNELEDLLGKTGFIVPSLDEGHSKFNKFNWLQVVARVPEKSF